MTVREAKEFVRSRYPDARCRFVGNTKGGEARWQVTATGAVFEQRDTEGWAWKHAYVRTDELGIPPAAKALAGLDGAKEGVG